MENDNVMENEELLQPNNSRINPIQGLVKNIKETFQKKSNLRRRL